MANYDQIEATYGYMDEFWRLSAGPHADVTCALFDGDETKTLQQAQIDKYEYIAAQIALAPGMRVLDVGCGWGGWLLYARQRGANGVGLTLSRRQQRACAAAGIDARLLDWNDAAPAQLGTFDAVVSVGAFEHFCSPEAYRAGRQEEIYRRFFALCHRVLRPGSRLFLQTMLWGAAVPEPARLTLSAPRDSNEYRLAALMRFYPGSWLPGDLAQIARSAMPYFSVEAHKNGRLDYIRTMREWGRLLTRVTWPKLLAGFRLLPYFLTDPDFARRIEVLWGNYNMRCFQDNVMEHERIAMARLDVETN